MIVMVYLLYEMLTYEFVDIIKQRKN